MNPPRIMRVASGGFLILWFVVHPVRRWRKRLRFPMQLLLSHHDRDCTGFTWYKRLIHSLFMHKVHPIMDTFLGIIRSAYITVCSSYISLTSVFTHNCLDPSPISATRKYPQRSSFPTWGINAIGSNRYQIVMSFRSFPWNCSKLEEQSWEHKIWRSLLNVSLRYLKLWSVHSCNEPRHPATLAWLNNVMWSTSFCLYIHFTKSTSLGVFDKFAPMEEIIKIVKLNTAFRPVGDSWRKHLVLRRQEITRQQESWLQISNGHILPLNSAAPSKRRRRRAWRRKPTCQF
jgi:hypothetical protein